MVVQFHQGSNEQQPQQLEQQQHQPSTRTNISQFSKLKSGAIVRFKAKDDDDDEDDWFECKLVRKAGKSGGKYKHSWNIVREGKYENIDFQRDVGAFEVLPSQDISDPAENTDADATLLEGTTTNEVASDCTTPAADEIVYEQAFLGLHGQETLAAKQRELESWESEHVYDEVDDEGQFALSTRWVLKPKIVDDTYIIKALLCAGGFEEEKIFRTDSPTCSREGIRIAFSVIATHRWDLKSIDVQTAFLQGKQMERIVYLKPPKEAHTTSLWKLRKCVYGLSDASRHWYLRVKEEILRLGCEVSQLDQGLFLFFRDGELHGILTCFVDDIVYGGDCEFEESVISNLKLSFAIGAENSQAFSYVGINVHPNSDKSITIDQDAYISNIQPMQISGNLDDEITGEEKTKFRCLAGQLNWVCGSTCPEDSFETCVANTRKNTPCVRDVNRLNKALKQLKSRTSNITFPNLNQKQLSIRLYTDASFKNLPNGGSQGGQIILL